MKFLIRFNKLLTAGVAAALITIAVATALFNTPASRAKAQSAEPPPAVTASVAVVTSRETAPTDEFSGRLEAIERVEIRSRVSGAIQPVHFREGALVKQGDLLITHRSGALCSRGRRAPKAQVAAARRASC